jgi:hypothetical protein
MKNLLFLIFFVIACFVFPVSAEAQCTNIKTGTIQASNPDFSGEIHYRRCDKLVSIWFENIERTSYSGFSPTMNTISTGLPGVMLPNQKGNRTFVAWITGTPPNVQVSSTPVSVVITQSGDLQIQSSAMPIGATISGSITFSKN